MIDVRSAAAPRSLGIRVLLVVAGSMLMALSAKLSVPMLPIPITGQTLAIPLLVALLGRNQATFAILAYLLEGALGLPVFAAGALMSATGGYLLAFPVAAFAIGTLYERGLDRNVGLRFAAVFAGTSLVFVGGVAWLVAFYGLSIGGAIAVGVVPFIVGDFIKCGLAAALAPAWPRVAAKLGL